MASEDSRRLRAAMSSSSRLRRLPPRFIGALMSRIAMNPSGDRCRPEWTSCVISRKMTRSPRLEARRGNRSKNGHPLDELGRLGDLEVEDTIASTSDRAHTEYVTQEARNVLTDLRHVERQSDPPRHLSTARSTDRNVEASFSVDEPGDVVTHIGRDSIHPD
jgi:hypothetical protein